MGLKGEPGYSGDLGEDVIGPAGEKGDQGNVGDRGRPASLVIVDEVREYNISITRGSKGEKGLRGQQGVKGIKGETGSVGLRVSIEVFHIHNFEILFKKLF